MMTTNTAGRTGRWMRRPKAALLLMALGITLGGFAACGGGDNSSSDNGSSDSSDSQDNPSASSFCDDLNLRWGDIVFGLANAHPNSSSEAKAQLTLGANAANDLAGRAPSKIKPAMTTIGKKLTAAKGDFTSSFGDTGFAQIDVEGYRMSQC